MASSDNTVKTGKGRRIVGADRQTLAKDLARDYQAGQSIRALAAPPAARTGSCTGSWKSPGSRCASVAAHAAAKSL